MKFERLDAPDRFPKVRDRFANVDNRFGIQTRHRGAADMLDVEYIIADRPAQPLSFLVEQSWPLLGIRMDSHEVVWQSDRHMISPGRSIMVQSSRYFTTHCGPLLFL
jgi:hypothetical protein